MGTAGTVGELFEYSLLSFLDIIFPEGLTSPPIESGWINIEDFSWIDFMSELSD